MVRELSRVPLMSKIESLTKNFGFMKRVRLRLFGKVYLKMKKRPGWERHLPFFIMKCRSHGLVETYAHGYKDELRCPECLREAVSVE